MNRNDTSYNKMDFEIEGTLKKLEQEDPEIKDALKKISGALMNEFKKRPWRYMNLLEIDPEIQQALNVTEKPSLTKVFVVVCMYVVGLVGLALFYVSGEKLDILNWRWWVVVLVAVVAVGLGVWSLRTDFDWNR